jgi:CP family cyanate transporter-like MFS transporter
VAEAGGRHPGTATTVAVLLLGLNLRAAVASVPPVLTHLGLSPGAQSWLVAIPVLCFGVAGLSTSYFQHRLGTDRLVLLLLVLLAAGLAWRAGAPGWALIPGTLVAGVGIAGLNVLLPVVVHRRFPSTTGAITAAYTVALGAGGALAAGLTVPIWHATGDSLEAALGVWGILVVPAIVAWVPEVRSVPCKETPEERVVLGARRLGRHRLVWGLTVFFGVQSLVYYAMVSWLPAVYESRGMSTVSAGVLLGVMNAAGIVGNLTVPVIATRTGDQRLVVTVCAVSMAVALAGILAAPTSTAWIWVVLFGASAGGAFSLSLLLVVLRSADGTVAVGLSSRVQGAGYLVAALGPLGAGLLHSATGQWRAPLLTLIGLLVAVLLPCGLVAGRSVRIGQPRPRLGTPVAGP